MSIDARKVNPGDKVTAKINEHLPVTGTAEDVNGLGRGAYVTLGGEVLIRDDHGWVNARITIIEHEPRKAQIIPGVSIRHPSGFDHWAIPDGTKFVDEEGGVLVAREGRKTVPEEYIEEYGPLLCFYVPREGVAE